MHNITTAYRFFTVANYLFLTFLTLASMFPILHILALSFSSSGAEKAGLVTFFPVEFTFKSYGFIFENNQFLISIWNSIKRVGLGVIINMALTVLVAYPLSKESSAFPQRTWYAWIFVFTMLFTGGLIPTFLVVKETGLLNSIWALILPGAVPVFNIVLMLNFFRSLPKELEEASYMDGAGHLRTLWYVYIPLSMAGMATVSLFAIVSHWNAWFDGLIYMRGSSEYPLSTYLQSILRSDALKISNLTLQEVLLYEKISNRTTRAAQIFVTALPILLVYPFLQKYFIKGLVMGSVKE